MRYSTKSKYKKYVKGYSFLSFARKIVNKYGKRIMETATKVEIDAAKTASKKLFKTTAEPTRDSIGNKIADKITSMGKLKGKTKEVERIYIPPE